MIRLDQVEPNPTNPRILKENKREKLVNSIIEFPEMMKLRPIIVDEYFIALGGNMRDRAIIEISNKGRENVIAYLEEVGKESNIELLEPIFEGFFPKGWIHQIKDLTDHQKKEFIVKDNVSFGEWDWNELANNWDTEELSDWGLNMPIFDSSDGPIDKPDDVEETKTLKLNYTEAEYGIVKEKLSKIASTPEQAVWMLINSEL